MTTLRRLVTTTADPTAVLDYLVNFENAVEWDAGTISCNRVSGDGGVGTIYRNRSTFAGRTVELEYTMESITDGRLVVVGRNKTTTSRDTVSVTPTDQGATVEYVAEFTFTGPARALGPLIRPLLNQLGDRTATQLQKSLDRLPA